MSKNKNTWIITVETTSKLYVTVEASEADEAMATAKADVKAGDWTNVAEDPPYADWATAKAEIDIPERRGCKDAVAEAS